jgi:hypothetical protein
MRLLAWAHLTSFSCHPLRFNRADMYVSVPTAVRVAARVSTKGIAACPAWGLVEGLVYAGRTFSLMEIL